MSERTSPGHSPAYGPAHSSAHSPERRPVAGIVALVIAVAALAGAWLWWQASRAPEPPPPVTVAPAAVPAPAAAAAASAPLAEAAPPAPAAALTTGELEPALTALLGRKAVLSFLQLDRFARRLVATVDNLGRSHAPPAVWPVNPTPGRFTVREAPDGPAIALDNAQRYVPLVLLAESVDPAKAVDLYLRMYPLLQQAYVELGYPKRQFNSRLDEVLGLLLATPQASQQQRLVLTEVKGPVESLRPWVRYQFADPALESLAAGQKMLLRMGPQNQQRLKACLAAFRAELARQLARQ